MLYGNKTPLDERSNVLVIVCGGSTATIESLLAMRG